MQDLDDNNPISPGNVANAVKTTAEAAVKQLIQQRDKTKFVVRHPFHMSHIRTVRAMKSRPSPHRHRQATIKICLEFLPAF
jgi:hypothetical protein